MIDIGWLLETWRAARWEAIVMIWNAIVAEVIARVGEPAGGHVSNL
jgi:hypothetical protein